VSSNIQLRPSIQKRARLQRWARICYSPKNPGKISPRLAAVKQFMTLTLVQCRNLHRQTALAEWL
jgi:hypothetical protein